jgi:RHS repeat-associated protein
LSTTIKALEMMQSMISAFPERMQKEMEKSMKHMLEKGPSPAGRTIMSNMGIDPDSFVGGMREGLRQIEQEEQTRVEIHFYHCDHLGTPIALTDRKGQIVWAARYDPWGNIEEEFNPLNIEQNIRLPGQHHDRETGLYYNRYRYYDPKIGAYINQDPIGLMGGVNFYGYPMNPMIGIDPLGLSDKKEIYIGNDKEGYARYRPEPSVGVGPLNSGKCEEGEEKQTGAHVPIRWGLNVGHVCVKKNVSKEEKEKREKGKEEKRMGNCNQDYNPNHNDSTPMCRWADLRDDSEHKKKCATPCYDSPYRAEWEAEQKENR